MKAVRASSGIRKNDARDITGPGASASSSEAKRSVTPAVTPPTTVELRGISIHFPFKPYKCQEDYMAKVLDALIRSENALLESPTGTGKTLCLLCSTLAWQREQARILKSQSGRDTIPAATQPGLTSSSAQETQNQRKRRVPTIIYASRTHSQLSQVVRELRNTRYRPKHAVLGSREQMCVNPKVKKPNGTSNASAINHDCSILIKDRRCKFKNKLEGFKAPSNESSSQGAWHGTQPVMDMEDLVTMGKTHQVCPFYYTRGQTEDAELVLLPYNYLFDKDSRATTLADIPWDNSVVIFDEAHNLESFASESASFDLSSKDIAGCMNEIDKALALSEAYPDRFMNIKTQNLLRLKTLFLNLEEYLLKKLPQQSTAYQGERIMEIFRQGASVNYNNYTLVLDEIKKIFDMFMEIRGGNSKGAPMLEHFSQCVKRVFGETTESRCLAKAQSYRVHLTQTNNNVALNTTSGSKGKYEKAGNGGRILSYWCFAPSEAMRELANLNVRSILVTSGTLSPLESYALELDIPFPNRLENPHIIAPHQIHVRVMGRGVSNKVLTSSYERRQNNDYYVELGNTLASLSRVIPCGMLVFFPSYGVMETSIERWGGPASSRSQNTNNPGNFFAARKKKNGGGSGNTTRYSFPRLATGYNQTHSTPWKRLLSHKAVVVEPRSTSDLPDAIDEFHKFLNLPNSKGVALFGVCRGKISEGIDFSHDMCRAVIITGLPFAPSFDPKVKMKREFLDQKKAKQNTKASTNGGFGSRGETNANSSLSGHDWYTQQAHRAVNQAIGRVIRNKRDYGAVLLMDSRFGLPGNQNGLSKWVRPHILPDEGFGRANQNLAQFYIKARENAKKEAELAIAQQSANADPTNVSIILKYEDEGKENDQLQAMANDDDITKVAFIRKDSVAIESGENTVSNDENYVDPQRIIVRVDMDKMSEEDVSSALAASSAKSIQKIKPNPVQKPSEPSSTSDKHKPKIISGKNPPVSTAVQFFHLVKSSTTPDEFDSIKKSTILLKKYEQMKFRKDFICAARSIIGIILNHEQLNNCSRYKKPKILLLLLKLIPKHFVKDVEQVTVDLTFRKSIIRKELKSNVVSKKYMKFHMEFVMLLQKAWFGESSRKNDEHFVQNLGKLIGNIVESHRVTTLALTQLIDVVPYELQRLSKALIEEVIASSNVSKIRAGEKARMGEDSVKVEYFRKNYLTEKGKSLSTTQDEDGGEHATSSTSMKPESQIHRSKTLKSEVDSRSNSQVSTKMKAVNNPYAKPNRKKRPQPSTTKNPTKSAGSITGHGKPNISLTKRKGILEQRKDAPAVMSSPSLLKSILIQSRADTFAGQTKKMKRTSFPTNAPKDVTCGICDMPLENVYISECGHMACLQCWKRWLGKNASCPTCRKPTTMKSIALAVFKGES